MASTNENTGVPDRSEELKTWVELYGPGLRRYFRKRVNAAEAEDLMQDVFLAMHLRRTGEPLESVEGYLFTVAANLLRKRKQREMTGLPDFECEAPESYSPERIVIYRQETTRVIAAIKSLPPRCREAFVLHRFENMSYLAIAHQLGISVSAVGKLIARALAQISSQMGERP